MNFKNLKNLKNLNEMTVMKRVYIKPDIEVIELASENVLQSTSSRLPEEIKICSDDDEYEPVVQR